MTGKERMLTALSLGQPDRVPVWELAFNEEQVKVTIGLSKAAVDFFKKEAKKHRTQYQKMIRRLLDLYVALQKRRKTG